MHARVATFENRDTTRVDELVALVKERSGAGKVPADALGMAMLIDRGTGTALGISLFEDEEAIRGAEAEFDRMGDEVPEELRGRRTSVETYEVAVSEISDDAAAARVSTYAGTPETIGDMVRNAEENVLPDARKLDGWKGVIVLVDRATGTSKTVTLWESTAALEASETAADALRQRVAAPAAGEITGIERYEVPVIFSRTPTLAS